MRTNPGVTWTVAVRGGFVVAFRRYGLCEFLGRDGFWCRHHRNAAPFCTEAEAIAAAS